MFYIDTTEKINLKLLKNGLFASDLTGGIPTDDNFKPYFIFVKSYFDSLESVQFNSNYSFKIDSGIIDNLSKIIRITRYNSIGSSIRSYSYYYVSGFGLIYSSYFSSDGNPGSGTSSTQSKTIIIELYGKPVDATSLVSKCDSVITGF
jgi:hypothetical protein